MFEGSELRIRHRRRVLKSCHLNLLDGLSKFTGVVKNLNGAGAMIELGDTYGVPNEFHFQMNDEGQIPAKVIWRNNRQMGIKFIN